MALKGTRNITSGYTLCMEMIRKIQLVVWLPTLLLQFQVRFMFRKLYLVSIGKEINPIIFFTQRKIKKILFLKIYLVSIGRGINEI